ncbi:MAG TPA: copper transporter [Bacillota bacterium]|nr:copper transporter [Bacillota bacterium]HOL09219.1 copper transporter [Bacillota bacterium]HPO97043.1 copper transporter [Bacillota bacterium]
MIVDLKYHVVSLVAVFLALGLGIIIGVNMGKTVNFEIEKQVQHLEETYQKIREDQKNLQASIQDKDLKLELANQFQKAIVPNLISNRLLGKRIAIIRTNPSVDFKYAKQIVDLLRQAGAEVTSITSFNKPISWDDPSLQTDIIDAFDLTMADDKALLVQIYDHIARLIILGEGSSQLIFLQNNDFIQLWGDYNRGTVDTIIFLGGSLNGEDTYQKEIDPLFMDAFRKLKVTLVGVEPSFVTQSYMRLYQSKCQGTVDNIETTPGEVTLVYLLASGKKGHFGVKETAKSLIPDFKLNF